LADKTRSNWEDILNSHEIAEGILRDLDLASRIREALKINSYEHNAEIQDLIIRIEDAIHDTIGDIVEKTEDEE